MGVGSIYQTCGGPDDVTGPMTRSERVSTLEDLKRRGAWELSNFAIITWAGPELLDTRGCRLSGRAAPSSAPALQFLGSAAPASKGSGEASLLMVARSTP